MVKKQVKITMHDTEQKGHGVYMPLSIQKNYIKSSDFTGLLLKMTVRNTGVNPLYEKAFLDRNEKPASEYNLNTTTWD